MAKEKESFQFYKHSDYIFHEDDWKKTMDLLIGNQECVQQKYLWVHPMEDPSRACDERDARLAMLDRKSRQERSQYVNYLSMVRDRFKALVLKGGFNPSEEVTSLLGEHSSNVDGNSNSLYQFAEKVIEDILAYGTSYILTDVKTLNNPGRSTETEVRPYWNRIDPLDMLDWEIGENGDFEAFRFEYRLLEKRERLSDEPFLAHYSVVGRKTDQGYESTTYVAAEKDSLQVINYHPECSDFKGDINLVWTEIEDGRQVISQLSELPLAVARIDEAALKQVLPISIKIYNRQSELDNILHNQCYDRIFVMSDLGTEGTLDDEAPLSDEAKTIKISTNTLVVLPEGSQVEKLSPTNPEALMLALAKDIQDLFLVAFKMARVLRADSNIAEAADTKREGKEDLFTEVESWRNKLLDIMNTALRHWAMAKGIEDFEGKLEFTRQLDERDFSDTLNFVRTMQDRIARYPTLDKALDKRLAGFFKLPEEDKIYKEIESTDIAQKDEERLASQQSRERLQSLVNTDGRQEQEVRPRNTRSRGPSRSGN